GLRDRRGSVRGGGLPAVADRARGRRALLPGRLRPLRGRGEGGAGAGGGGTGEGGVLRGRLSPGWVPPRDVDGDLLCLAVEPELERGASERGAGGGRGGRAAPPVRGAAHAALGRGMTMTQGVTV